LQGDRRKYVKNGKILDPNPSLENKNKENMKYPKVPLTAAQRKVIEKAIIEESVGLNQKIYVIAIRKSHIHLVTDCNYISASSAVSHYKNAARLAMESNGFVGRLWTKGFSVRYCFDENQLNAVIKYVNRHNRKVNVSIQKSYGLPTVALAKAGLSGELISQSESPTVYPVG